MPATPQRQTDPLRWCAAISLIFAAAVGWHLGIPGKLVFDEVHYVPAARALLALRPANSEHPLVAKEAIAAAITLLGDHPLSWRLPSAVMGSIGLFAFGRALWWASRRRYATLAGMVLLASDFAWFVQSRIAMLDMVMAGFAMLALWQIAAAFRLPAQARWRLALAGLAFGLALGAKWSVAPMIAVVALALAALRSGSAAPSDAAMPGDGGPPLARLSLAEIMVWLLTLPIAVYWLTFAPAFFYRANPLSPRAFLAWQHTMLQLQESVLTRHPYQSVWYQWVGNWRPIWYLYERVDGAQRGIILLGNPWTMLAGLAALPWCLWAGWRGRGDALAVVCLYAACLGLWVLPGKPVQFYYHYLLPGTLLMAALALGLDALWQRRGVLRWLAPCTLALALALFAWFYPIIAAAPLDHGSASFEAWMWLASWR